MDAIFRAYFAPLFEHMNPCPCKREGKGCINYFVQEHEPYYVCRFTEAPAFVPKDENIGDWSCL